MTQNVTIRQMASNVLGISEVSSEARSLNRGDSEVGYAPVRRLEGRATIVAERFA